MALRCLISQIVRNGSISLPAAAMPACTVLVAKTDLHGCSELPRGFASETAGGEESSAPGSDASVSAEGTIGTGTEADVSQDMESAAATESVPRRRKGRRPTRAEKGSYADGALARELNKVAVQVPDNMPMYDVRTDMPWHFEPRSKQMELLQRIAEAEPELLEMLEEEEYPPPYPGARPILEWESQMVLVAGGDELSHPLNKKARLRVYLRDLQEECGLSDAALQHMALICGPRYDPRKGVLTLTSDKYPHREDNRRDILDTLHKLIDEGERAFPQSDPQIRQLQQRRRQAREDVILRGTPPPDYDPLSTKRRESQPLDKGSDIRAAGDAAAAGL